MRAALRLEDINTKDAKMVNAMCRQMGERPACPSRAWVARVRINANGYVDRDFLRADAVDYSDANGAGSRGIFKCYWLDERAYYEVSAPQSWRGTDRYFCETINGEIIRMTKEEVQDAQL
ncbi:hypothetical protein LCGC14_0259290 [marine sediment metagenome]|uniref:Uncharacterized protein n=1 Tax=marine sediment metagenome TaxID=412755 RepID=A0A0F9U794_9ZZZZ